jgi:hypothetical protein
MNYCYYAVFKGQVIGKHDSRSKKSGLIDKKA